ncbi:MAG TPA: hypothetical protein VM487_02380, partial [Phycisphaerae bacterium]|nr:hypothetical protein [Phycisphaerae bacterium]
MKKIISGLIALLVCGATTGWAAQDTDISPREVRDPRLLEIWLEANATDAESRITTGATNSNQIILTAGDGETAWASFQADAPSGLADDAGDKYAIVATDGSGLAIQSDASAKGTLATKLTISSAGGIAAADAITLTDANGAAVITAIGYEAGSASLVLDADIGTDNNDTVTITAADGGTLSVYNHTTEIATLTSAGALAVDAGISAGDAITLTDTDGAAVLTLKGFEAGAASLVLDADEGDNDADTVTFSVADGGVLSILNHTTEIATLSTVGALALDAGITVGDAITLTEADGAAAITATAASGAYDATLVLDADAGENDADTWIIESEAADNDLSFVNNATERMKIAAAGGVTIPQTLAVTGESTLTAGVECGARLEVAGDQTNAGSLTVTGAVVMSSTLDVDSVTVDIGAGMDTQAAGDLKLGASTATSIDIGDTAVNIT